MQLSYAQDLRNADYLIVSIRGPARPGDPAMTICGMALVQHRRVRRELYIDVICSREDHGVRWGQGPSLWAAIDDLKSMFDGTRQSIHSIALCALNPADGSTQRLKEHYRKAGFSFYDDQCQHLPCSATGSRGLSGGDRMYECTRSDGITPVIGPEHQGRCSESGLVHMQKCVQ